MHSLPIYETEAGSILSATAGFIAAAGFTHSLTPARNCTYGCTYCYVPTLGIYGGLKPDDWRHWGQFSTFKSNAAALLRRALRPHQVIYCSPLVDPYQPAEAEARHMPAILAALAEHPPRAFTLQTRGPLILRDLEALVALAARTTLRVSFSITTNREEIRRRYEPHCAPLAERWETVRALHRAGIETYATLAPLLPCDPEALLDLALAATPGDIIGDPLHTRASKPRGATTREAACKISQAGGCEEWHDPAFQDALVARMKRHAQAAGRCFVTGTDGFSRLARPGRLAGAMPQRVN